MKHLGWIISKYLLWAIAPYFVFSWLLLSVILFVQQASRFSDIFFGASIPAHLAWQLTVALIPNVISFTAPMAVLLGTIIGLSKLQGDSELVVIRASGVANFQIHIPIILLGAALSVFAFMVNLKGVPVAASLVRRVALQTALQKLESPIEPGIFNTEIGGYTIYARSGDIARGFWSDLFIFNQDPSSGSVRLITAETGRIDLTDQNSELVLGNARVVSMPALGQNGNYTVENLGDVRLAIRTRRGELIQKLGEKQSTPEELGLDELADYAESKEGKDRIEAQILGQRRLILSITPLIFCILGTSMILRFSRGGRGFGVFLALISLIGYFLLAFLGEQLGRTANVPVIVGGALPILGSLIAIGWFSLSGKVSAFNKLTAWFSAILNNQRRTRDRMEMRSLFVDLTTGLRDFDLIKDLLKYFLLALGFLSALFVIFTAFDLWRFAGTIDGGVWMLASYLLFLLPFIYLQIAPTSAMIATLATYVIKSRQNEIVTWTSAGESVYRLLVPCFLGMILLGLFNWVIHERVAPPLNRLQDEYRNQIRRGGATVNNAGRYWVAEEDRIYSFETRQEDRTASDNEKRLACGPSCVTNVSVYLFNKNRSTLQTVYRSNTAEWSYGRVIMNAPVEQNTVGEGSVSTLELDALSLDETEDPFDELGSKPSHLTVAGIRREATSRDSDTERRTFAIALQKRYSTLFLPLVISMFTAPFALSIRRSSRVVTLGYAIGLWLFYTCITNLFEQFGLSGYLQAELAIWGPLVIFSMIGIYLISRVRT
jgi:lipopolysaccharide export LptBFGC system permease protein LptF